MLVNANRPVERGGLRGGDCAPSVELALGATVRRWETAEVSLSRVQERAEADRLGEATVTASPPCEEVAKRWVCAGFRPRPSMGAVESSRMWST